MPALLYALWLLDQHGLNELLRPIVLLPVRALQDLLVLQLRLESVKVRLRLRRLLACLLRRAAGLDCLDVLRSTPSVPGLRTGLGLPRFLCGILRQVLLLLTLLVLLYHSVRPGPDFHRVRPCRTLQPAKSLPLPFRSPISIFGSLRAVLQAIFLHTNHQRVDLRVYSLELTLLLHHLPGHLGHNTPRLVIADLPAALLVPVRHTLLIHIYVLRLPAGVMEAQAAGAVQRAELAHRILAG